MFTFCVDKQRLLRHFHKDPVLFAYHIGDLDDRYFADCQFAAIYDQRARVEDCVLIYNGLTTPTVLGFGLTQRFGGLIDEIISILPLRFYAHFQSIHQQYFLAHYSAKLLGAHLKMRLDRFKPDAVGNKHQIDRLTEAHAAEVVAFYRKAYPEGYFEPQMLSAGKYLGVLVKGELRAIAGLHVYSPEYGVAVLGGIATLPSYRGHGLATELTAALCKELVGEGLMVCLNVRADNVPAIRCYTRLGFQQVHDYEEALFEIR